MKITGREKTMLAVLAVIIFAFCGYKFLLKPTIDAYAANSAILEQLTLQRSNGQILINSYGDMEETISRQKTQADEYSAPFFPSLDAQDINIWLESYMRNAHFTFKSISIGQPAVTTIEQMSDAGDDNDYPIGGYAEGIYGTSSPQPGVSSGVTATGSGSSSSSDSSSSRDDSAADDSVLCSSVKLTVTTDSFENLKSFCDAIKNCGRTVVIRDISFSKSSSDASVYDVVVNLDFYAVGKNADDVFDWGI